MMLEKKSDTHFISDLLKSLPGSIYWKDKKGAYLGCNETMLKMAGMDDIIGKTDFDMPWFDTAKKLQENDQYVILFNTTLVIEETVCLSNGQNRLFLSRKAPLMNDNGEIIGIIGTSLDITERKALEQLQQEKDKAETALKIIKQAHLEEQKCREMMEQLRLENAAHKAKLEAQEHFTRLAQQVVHDIRSPLSSILMIVKASKTIPEREKMGLIAATTRLSEIANDLLKQYKLKQFKSS